VLIQMPDLARLDTPARRRTLHHGVIVGLVVLLAGSIATEFVRGWDGDPYYYWSTHIETLYHGYTISGGTYAYSPAFAQLFAPFTALPWPVFRFVWAVIAGLVLWWLSRPVSGAWKPAFLLFGAIEIIQGNIHLLLAGAIAVAARWPAAWSFVLLSKVTPGVGLLWYPARREWRAFSIAIGATISVVAVSALVAPDLWLRWIDTLIANRDGGGVTIAPQVPLIVRLPVAAVIVVWGARHDQPWTIAAASCLAVPHFWLASLVILTAIPRLHQALAPAAMPAGGVDGPVVDGGQVMEAPASPTPRRSMS